MSSELHDHDQYPLQKETTSKQFTVSNSPLFPPDMSDMEEDEFSVQSPPLIPTSSTLPPPRPDTPPSPFTLEKLPSSVSEASSRDSFPMRQPLWLLG
jgi:hypothetical protein